LRGAAVSTHTDATLYCDEFISVINIFQRYQHDVMKNKFIMNVILIVQPTNAFIVRCDNKRVSILSYHVGI